MLNYGEIKKWDAKAIDAKILELKRELFNYRMQKGTTSIEKPHLVKEVKSDIARLNTALSAIKSEK